MKTSLLISVGSHAPLSMQFLGALAKVCRRTKDLELFFVGDSSNDASLNLLEKAHFPAARVIRGSSGGAAALNDAIAACTGELLLFLAADCLPSPGWAEEMEKALGSADLVVGHTAPKAARRDAYGKLAEKLFTGHSARVAKAEGHALPWGPIYNLGIRRALLEKVGPFSPDASSAFDIDWCWRAMLARGRICFAAKARAELRRAWDRASLLTEFERYGQGEVWLARTYSFLLDHEEKAPSPFEASLAAFVRLRHHSRAAHVKALAKALEEVALAYSGGVRMGWERMHRECSLPRSLPKGSIYWPGDRGVIEVFAPGRGLATLSGKERQIFEAIEAGEDDAFLVKLFMRLYKVKEPAAKDELLAFRENFFS